MKITAISVVHGNVFALDAVLTEISHQMVDVTVNLGNHLSGDLALAETIDGLLDTLTFSIRGERARHVLENDYETKIQSDGDAPPAVHTGDRARFADLRGVGSLLIREPARYTLRQLQVTALESCRFSQVATSIIC